MAFYLQASADADWYNLRITTGWWSTTWTGADIGKGDECLILNEDGTFTLELNFSGDPILDVLDDQHLLFTATPSTSFSVRRSRTSSRATTPADNKRLSTRKR